MFKVICRDKDTGKTKELLELAYQENATIITSTPRSLKVKAQSLGYEISICSWGDFINSRLETRDKIIIDNAEEVLFSAVTQANGNKRLIAMAVNTDAYT